MLIAIALLATSAAHATDLTEGREAYKPCGVCHGVRAEGVPDLHAPALSGLDADVIVRQLKAYKEGRRGASPIDVYGRQMAPMGQTLHDEAAMKAVAAYVRSFDLPPAPAASELSEAGKPLYATCAACHGANGEGGPGGSLLGLDAVYLARQLHNYREGLRGNDETNPLDVQMGALVGVLPDERAILAVSAYIATLRPQPAE